MDLNQVFNELDDMMRRSDIARVIPFLEEKCKEAEAVGDGGALVSILNELVGFCTALSSPSCCLIALQSYKIK